MTAEVKVSMMNNMDHMFEIIEERSTTKKCSIDEADNISNNASQLVVILHI